MMSRTYPDDYCRADYAAYGLCTQRPGHEGRHCDANGHRWSRQLPHRGECNCGRCPSELVIIETASIAVGDVLLPEEYDENLLPTDYDIAAAVCKVTRIDDSRYQSRGLRVVWYVYPDGMEDNVSLGDDMRSLKLVKKVSR